MFSAGAFLQWTSGVNDPLDSSTIELALLRDGAANTLALRNGAAAQTFRVYNTYTDASNYGRLELGPITGGGDYYLIASNAGTGIARGINIRAGTGRNVYLGIGSTDILNLSTTSLSFLTDNTYDIGASGANRPRNIYAGSGIVYTSSVLSASGSSGTFGTTGTERTYINQNSLRIFGFDSGLFLLGSAFSSANPAIKRNGTELQARLADDLAFTFIQGKLKTDTAFTSGAITDTGYIVLYDSTGTAYKVACTPV
jgi:hypothetical protein